jgi:hypothetical protein
MIEGQMGQMQMYSNTSVPAAFSCSATVTSNWGIEIFPGSLHFPSHFLADSSQLHSWMSVHATIAYAWQMHRILLGRYSRLVDPYSVPKC